MSEERDSDAAVDAVDFKYNQEEAERPALERCPKCHLVYVEGSNGVCLTDHAFVPNKQCSGTTCDICDETKKWHDKRDEHLRRRRALMPNYDQRLKEWLS